MAVATFEAMTAEIASAYSLQAMVRCALHHCAPHVHDQPAPIEAGAAAGRGR